MQTKLVDFPLNVEAVQQPGPLTRVSSSGAPAAAQQLVDEDNSASLKVLIRFMHIALLDKHNRVCSRHALSGLRQSN